jgi:hypothetical protein
MLQRNTGVLSKNCLKHLLVRTKHTQLASSQQGLERRFKKKLPKTPPKTKPRWCGAFGCRSGC